MFLKMEQNKNFSLFYEKKNEGIFKNEKIKN